MSHRRSAKPPIKKWFKKGDWNTGLSVKVFDNVNKQEFYNQYHANKSVWDKAFQFLKEQNLDSLESGKYPIEGQNIFASVTESYLNPFEKTGWEFHKDYIDLQYIISGKERIGMAPVAKNTTSGFGKIDTSAATYYIAQPDTLYIFFPHDAHRPTIEVEPGKKVKKLVIKIKVVPLIHN